MDASLVKMLNQSITVDPFTGRDGANQPAFNGVSRTLACFVYGRVLMVRNAAGQEVVSQQQVLVEGNGGGIGLLDRITLPGGRKPPIIHLEPGYDENGNMDHLLIYL